jgi:hypothetical protein
MAWSDAQIDALRAVSSEGRQEWIGQCQGVIHHHYTTGNTYIYAAGFVLQDGSETPRGQQSYAPFDVTVTDDGCATNGAPGAPGYTRFLLRDPALPVRNLWTRDNGDAGERFGSPLRSHPAYLR